MLAVEEMEQLTINVIFSSLMKHNVSSTDSKNKFPSKGFLSTAKANPLCYAPSDILQNSTQKIPTNVHGEMEEETIMVVHIEKHTEKKVL